MQEQFAMFATARRVLPPVVWLALSATALGGPIGVRDRARLFKSETVQKADEQIEQIRERFQTDLLIETVEAMPEEQQRQLKGRHMDAAARRRFFGDWAAQEARKAGAEGIYVWICENPRRAEVVVGPAVPAEAFTLRNGEKLSDYFLSRKFEKSPDAELRRGILYVRDTLESGTRPTVWPWVVGLVLAVLAVWGLVGVLRSREAAQPAADPPPQNPEPPAAVEGEGEPDADESSDYHTHSDRGPV